jgi:transposase
MPRLPTLRQAQESMRLQTVRRSEDGESVAQIAVALGVSKRAVYQWIAAHQRGGDQALLGKKGPGRPPRLGPGEIAHLIGRLRNQTPDQLGFPFGLWTADRVGRLIARLYRWKPSMPTVWKFMRELGCSAQMPHHRAWQADRPRIQHWRAERLPVIRARAKVKCATILYAEASGIHPNEHRSDEASADLIQLTPTPNDDPGMNLLSAAPACGEMEFMLCNAPPDGRVWVRFLEQLMIGRSAPVILVMDGESIRDTELLRLHAASTNGRLELEFMPAD